MKKNEIKDFVIPDFSKSPAIDKVGVEERVSRFQSRSIKNETSSGRFV